VGGTNPCPMKSTTAATAESCAGGCRSSISGEIAVRSCPATLAGPCQPPSWNARPRCWRNTSGSTTMDRAPNLNTSADEAALAAAQDLAKKAARPGPVLRGNEGDWANFRSMVPAPTALCRSRLRRRSSAPACQPGRQPREDHHSLAAVGHRQIGRGSDQGYAQGRVDAATADG
jgi:hypothetical protein